MSFRRRDYPEVLDNVLTAMVGGVSAEAHPFPPPGQPTRVAHPLDKPPARQIVSVTGTRNGGSFRFRDGADYALDPGGGTLVWQKGAQLPDPGTLITVNYLRRDDPASLTDLEVGGVARTIVELVGLEIARLYAQLEAVYDAGFLETATGGALEKVVALLGIRRIGADRPTAELRFERTEGTSGAITIPAGTRVIDAEAKVEYETVEAVTMMPSQARITVVGRDVEPANDPVVADVLVTMAVPIAGIARVTNPAPASRAATAETDDELRTRARAFLHGSERATLGALGHALARQQVSGEIAEPADRPGVVVITPVSEGLSPERRAQLSAALEDVRPVGVRVELAGAQVPAKVSLELSLTTREGLSAPEVAAAHEAVREAVSEHFKRLPLREDARINKLVGDVLKVPGVEDVTLVSADLADGLDVLDLSAGVIRLADMPTVLGDLAIADPGLPTAVDLTVTFPGTAAVPERQAVVSAVEVALAHLEAAASDPATPAAERTLSMGQLLHLLPPPIGAGQSLFAQAEAAPDLPSTSDVADYTVSLFLRQAGGLTRVLASDGDAYEVTPMERLALQSAGLELED